MRTVDLFIAAKERYPIMGMSLEQPVLIKIGHVSWDDKGVTEYEAQFQQSGTDEISASIVESLLPEIQRAFQNALRLVQAKHVKKDGEEENHGEDA